MRQPGESDFFRAWAQTVLRFRLPTVLMVAAFSVLCIFQVRTQLTINTSPEYFTKGGSDTHAILDEFREDFGRDDLYLVLVKGNVFTPDFMDRLRTLHEALEEFQTDLGAEESTQATEAVVVETEETVGDDWVDEGDWGDDEGWDDDGHHAENSEESGGSVIEDVTSLINFRQTVFQDGAIRVKGLLDEPPSVAELPALREKVLADSNMVGAVVGKLGNHAVLAVRSQRMTEKHSRQLQGELERLTEGHSSPEFKIHVSGMPSVERTLTNTITSDMRRLGGSALALMAIILFALFRHPIGVVGPVIVMVLSIVWTLGSMAMTHTPVTLLTNIIPAFVICVGLGDSVHVQSVYRDLRKKGIANHDAIVSAVGSTGVPILFTTLTTMVGLLSFRFASTLGIQEMGTAAAGGVFCALVLSLTVLPVTLSLIGEGKLRSKDIQTDQDTIDRVLAFCTDLSNTPSKRLRTFGVGFVVVLVAILGIFRLEVFHDPLSWMPQDGATYIGMMELDEHVGGAGSVAVVLEADGELGVKDQELLAGIEKLEQHVLDFEHPRTGKPLVSSTTSLLNIIKETNRALHEGDESHYVLPADQRAVSDTLLLFENAGPKDLRRLATADLKKTHLSMRLNWMDATSYLPLTAHLEEGIQTYIGDKAKATPTGTVYSIVSVVGVLIGDMMRSFGVAVVVISLMMMVLLGNPKLGIVAMVPNIVPVILILGFMGFIGIPIDLASLLIASLVIGIAVDDTIHYLHQYRVVHDQKTDTEAGIAHALDHAGRALVSTSLILCIGFSAYLAGTMANVQRFGILVASACVFALFTNLILVPALLRHVHRGSHVDH